ncbi:MAG: arsenite efflux transporter metallochaperone ArsD [Burkholderiales bacterium]|nr:arsenite efflux transporter metallochaperone ArsD [Burkholderiales bacterium]
MATITVYDPALCCNSGVCGVDVDQQLVSFAADMAWLKAQGQEIARFNLGQQPMAFAENAVVKAFLERSGAEGLPLILVDEQIAMAGRYPRREELARWAGISVASDKASESGAAGSTCCGACNC